MRGTNSRAARVAWRRNYGEICGPAEDAARVTCRLGRPAWPPIANASEFVDLDGWCPDWCYRLAWEASHRDALCGVRLARRDDHVGRVIIVLLVRPHVSADVAAIVVNLGGRRDFRQQSAELGALGTHVVPYGRSLTERCTRRGIGHAVKGSKPRARCRRTKGEARGTSSVASIGQVVWKGGGSERLALRTLPR